MKLLRILLLLIAASVISAPAFARDWLKAETPGFVIYSDGYPHELERWARKLEAYDALLKARYGVQNDPLGSKLTVYLLEDENDVSRLVGPKNLTGFYSASSQGSFAIASRAPAYYKNRLSGQITLFHEYAHHFMYRHLTSAYPAWYREGFAEYASTADFDMDWRATFGAPVYFRLNDLKKDPMPIETILSGSVEDFKSDERARFYAWSWKLVHMLNSSAERKGELDRYLQLFAGGTPGAQAATMAFGDLARLEADLRAYQPSERGQLVSTRPIDVAADVTAVALDERQSQLIDLRLDRIVNRATEDDLRAARALVATYPDDPQVQLELALMEKELAENTKQADPAVAETAARRAMALSPHDPRTVAVWADLAMRRLRQSTSGSQQEWGDLRRKLRIATDLGPDDPLALMTYYRSYAYARLRPPADAFKAMDRAFALQPESYEVRLSEIFALSLRNRIGEARALALVLASDPHASGIGRKALASLDRMTGTPTPCPVQTNGDKQC